MSGGMMLHTTTRQIHSEFTEFVTSNPSLEEMADFRLSNEAETRIHYLLEMNGEGNISRDEQEELDDYLRLEHIMRMIKIRAIEKLNRK
jgi:hypothetical protein